MSSFQSPCGGGNTRTTGRPALTNRLQFCLLRQSSGELVLCGGHWYEVVTEGGPPQEVLVLDEADRLLEMGFKER